MEVRPRRRRAPCGPACDAHPAPAGTARAPKPARSPSRRSDEAPDASRLRPSSRAAQAGPEEIGADATCNEGNPRKRKQQRGDMDGGEWAEKHGGAWQQFLTDHLKGCECENPRVSCSNRRNALEDTDKRTHEKGKDADIAQAEPAACLVCFAPIEREVLHAGPPAALLLLCPPPPPPLGGSPPLAARRTSHVLGSAPSGRRAPGQRLSAMQPRPPRDPEPPPEFRNSRRRRRCRRRSAA